MNLVQLFLATVHLFCFGRLARVENGGCLKTWPL